MGKWGERAEKEEFDYGEIKMYSRTGNFKCLYL
jgi:hypothetical protein